jgi:hypothetical protein
VTTTDDRPASAANAASASANGSAEAPSREFLIANEGSILDGLLRAAETAADETHPVEIVRNGQVVLRWRIRPLAEHEYEECEDEAATTERSRQAGGMKIRTDFDAARYRSLLIYTATVDEDRAKLWDSEEAQKKLLSGKWDLNKRRRAADLIERVLRAGEKSAVVALIDKVSGFGTDLTDSIKN